MGAEKTRGGIKPGCLRRIPIGPTACRSGTQGGTFLKRSSCVLSQQERASITPPLSIMEHAQFRLKTCTLAGFTCAAPEPGCIHFSCTPKNPKRSDQRLSDALSGISSVTVFLFWMDACRNHGPAGAGRASVGLGATRPSRVGSPCHVQQPHTNTGILFTNLRTKKKPPPQELELLFITCL